MKQSVVIKIETIQHQHPLKSRNVLSLEQIESKVDILGRLFSKSLSIFIRKLVVFLF